MKILMVIDSLAKGGRERRMVSLIKSLWFDWNFSISLIVLSSIVEYPEVKKYCAAFKVIERKPKTDPRVFFKIFRYVKSFSPAIIHTWGSMSTIYSIPSSTFTRTPLVNASIADAPDMNYANYIYRRTRMTFPFSHAIVGNSKAGLKAYDAPDEKSLCIYNGFDFQRINDLEDKDTIYERYNIDSHQVIGMVAAFQERKDYHTFILAALKLLDKKRDVSIICVGDGEKLQEIKNSIPDKFKHHFTFTGNITDVESVINIFDIAVLTTNANFHGEGISNSIMEYMALSKPVIATNTGGTPEIVLDGKNGYLVEDGNQEELFRRLDELLTNPMKRLEMGEYGLQRLRENFSIGKMVHSYLGIYQSLATNIN